MDPLDFDSIPDHGWGLVEWPLPAILFLHEAGLIKAHVTPVQGVWQVRLTGKGRQRWRRGDVTRD